MGFESAERVWVAYKPDDHTEQFIGYPWRLMAKGLRMLVKNIHGFPAAVGLLGR